MTKKAAIINDLSGLGRCSLTAAIPVISCLGVQACPVATAVLTNQTAYDSFYMEDFTDGMSHYIEEWKKLGAEFDGILTGFMADERQVRKVERFIREFRKPETLLVVDPVMGEDGQLYSTYTPELCDRMCKLALSADVITPNLTEACILLGMEPDMNLKPEIAAQMAVQLMEKGPSRVVITGVVENEWIYNVIGENGSVDSVKVRSEGGYYSGTGDIMAAVVTAGLIQGKYSLKAIVEVAAQFIGMAMAEARKDGTDGNDGIAFEKYLHILWEKLG